MMRLPAITWKSKVGIALLLVMFVTGGALVPFYANEADAALPLLLIPAAGALGALGAWGASEAAEEVGERVVEGGLSLLSYTVQLIAQLGTWLLDLVSNILGSVVTIGSFVTNPIVASGWPFLQGLANFGFILALLVIAVTTALRVDIGGGARRLLPRLLLGAILINFSLLIGGIIIDISRLLMALFANLAGSNLADLGIKIVQQSQLVQNVFTVTFDGSYLPVSFQEGFDIGTIDGVVRVAQATIFIWGLMIGMLVITVTLVIRYVMLLLLLIVSPLVYVAIAFPGASGLASKWWSRFLREVFYGPIAMFALVMLATVGSAQGNITGLSPIAADFLTLVITVVALFVVATSGRQWGATGANAAINGVKQLRDPRKAGAAIALGSGLGPVGILGGYLGGALLGRTGTNARDLGQTFAGNVTKRAREGKYGGAVKFIAGPERDDKGNLKKGQSSIGSALAQPKKTLKDFDAGRTGKRASAIIGNDRTKVPTAITVEQLINPNTTEALSNDAYKAALQSPDSSQIQAVVTGTIKQQQISKDQAKTLVVTLHDTMTSTASTPAEKALAKSLMEEILRQKKIVDKLDDSEMRKVFDLNDKKLTQTLIRTLSKEEKT